MRITQYRANTNVDASYRQEILLQTTQVLYILLVAINKCDREEAEVDACKQDLAENGVVLEELGGDVIGVEISALKGL